MSNGYADRCSPSERSKGEPAPKMLFPISDHFDCTGGNERWKDQRTWDQIAAFVGHLDEKRTQGYIHFMLKGTREARRGRFRSAQSIFLCASRRSHSSEQEVQEWALKPASWCVRLNW